MNNLFKFKGKPLLYDKWIKSNIIYVHDLLDHTGEWINETNLQRLLVSNRNLISEYVTIKNVIGKIIKKGNFSTGNSTYINVCNKCLFNTGNKIIEITNQKSNFFFL